MSMRSVLVSVALLFGGLCVEAWAQAPPGATPPPKEMATLAKFVGRWEGSGRMSRGPGQSVEARASEHAQLKLQGWALLIEGRGVVTTQAGREMVVHDALAVLWYDTAAQRFVMRAHRPGGEVLQPDVQVADSRITWSFSDARAGHIRFTATVDAGRWREIGEISRDGATWTPFFEMDLRKVAEGQ